MDLDSYIKFGQNSICHILVNDNNALYMEAMIDNLYLKKHMFLQCIAKINDMYVLSKNNIQS